MSWFIFALITTLAWGCADLLYKKGSDEDDSLSHIRIAVWVGLVMGIVSIALIPFSESGFDLPTMAKNALLYTPASLSYIISMVIGYAGLRYLELSIVSPVQNASGAFSAIAMIIWMMAKGSIDSISDEYGILDICGTAVIVIGVVLLAFVEQKISKEEQPESDRKYTRGALALIFPLLYCIFDTIGTAADGIILDGEHGLGLGEIDVLVLYGLTFLLAGIGCWIFLLIREHKPYNPFARHELWKGAAASAEQFGQIFYVFAMSRNPVLAAPMIASYCIVSVILSRVFLGEKLRRNQAMCVALVIIGIVALGISEGLGEM